MRNDEYTRFKHLTFEGFRELATQPGLSRYQKIGFPNSYREGKEEAIFADIRQKLTVLGEVEKCIIDIGAGCSNLPRMLANLCVQQRSRLTLIDSPEMLNMLPDAPGVSKLPGRFPDGCRDFIDEQRGKVDGILVYSVFQYIFAEGNIFHFLDCCMELLGEGGELLIGDIPNISKRKRFFASESGIRLHREFTGRDEIPNVDFNRLEKDEVDDSVILAVLARARLAGFDAYVLPQAISLPIATRREDILIRRP